MLRLPQRSANGPASFWPYPPTGRGETAAGGGKTPPPADLARVVPALRQEVVRVGHLEGTVAEATVQIAELVAEAGHDVVAQRLDVLARRRLVVVGSAHTVRVAGACRLQVRRVVGDRGLGEQAVLAVTE